MNSIILFGILYHTGFFLRFYDLFLIMSIPYTDSSLAVYFKIMSFISNIWDFIKQNTKNIWDFISNIWDFISYMFFLRRAESILLSMSLMFFIFSFGIVFLYLVPVFIWVVNHFGFNMLDLVTISSNYSSFEGMFGYLLDHKNLNCVGLIILCMGILLQYGIEFGQLMAEIFVFLGISNEYSLELIKKGVIIKDDNRIPLKHISLDDGVFTYDNVTFEELEEYRILMSKDLNEYIWELSEKNNGETYKKIEEDESARKNVKNFIRERGDILSLFFRYKFFNSLFHKKLFFNGNELCMASEISKIDEYVRCYPGRFYNSFLTNEICTSVLKRQDDDSIVLYDASSFYPCECEEEGKKEEDNLIFRLQHLDKSPMNNNIGVSVLAITKDNYMVIRKQGTKTQQSNNKYIPTGSGSCNWLDIEDNDFINTIKHAMIRELCEENGLDVKDTYNKNKDNLKILGFFRWLQRGGKPEFVGVIKLNRNHNELNVNTNELKRIDYSTLPDKYKLTKVDEVPKVIAKIKNMPNLSLPLHVCLDTLQDYYKNHPEQLKSFLEIA